MVMCRVVFQVASLERMWLGSLGHMTEEVDYYQLLRTAEHLIAIKVDVGENLYNELVMLFNPDVDVVFYDLTSSYFELEGPELAEYG
jgi:hypothetical protein